MDSYHFILSSVPIPGCNFIIHITLFFFYYWRLPGCNFDLLTFSFDYMYRLTWYQLTLIDTHWYWVKFIYESYFHDKHRNTMKAQSVSWDSDFGDFDFDFFYIYFSIYFSILFFRIVIRSCNLWKKNKNKLECKQFKGIRWFKWFKEIISENVVGNQSSRIQET